MLETRCFQGRLEVQLPAVCMFKGLELAGTNLMCNWVHTEEVQSSVGQLSVFKGTSVFGFYSLFSSSNLIKPLVDR
jgi:hypothetical protein